jgi:hypothetical protein
MPSFAANFRYDEAENGGGKSFGMHIAVLSSFRPGRFSYPRKRGRTAHVESQFLPRVSQLRIEASLVNAPERIEIGLLKWANLEWKDW